VPICAAALLVSLPFLKKSGDRAGRNIGVSVGEDEFRKSVVSFAAEIKNRAVRSGGFSPFGGGAIRKAYRIIDRKIKRKEKVYEFEKWIYDNYYILNAPGGFKSLKRLPAVEGKPVIVRLAEHIVSVSADSLNSARVKNGVGYYADINSLSVDEVLLLKEGFNYAVFGAVCKMAARSVLLNRARRAAAKKKIDGRFLRSASYLYFLYNGRPEEKVKAFLEKNGIDYGNINYVFAAEIAESDAHTAALIAYLLEKDAFDGETVLSFSKLNEKMRADAVYVSSDAATKTAYLKRVAALSQKVRMSQTTFFDLLIKKAAAADIYYGELIFYYAKDLLDAVRKNRAVAILRDRSENKRRLYSLGVFALAATFTLAAVLIINSIYFYIAAPLFFAVFLRTAFCALNSAIGRLVPNRAVFGYDYSEVAEQNAAMVVISQYIVSETQMEEAIRKAEILAAANGGKHIEYALLIDLPPAKNPIDEKDAPIMDVIEGYGGNLSFFVRGRTGSFGRFSGYERKRGAIAALSKFIADGGSETGGFRLIKRGKKTDGAPVKFFVLLDDDSELLPGSVVGLINRISHPLNARYDLLTLGARYNLYGADSLYGGRFKENSGVESYPYYSGLFDKLLGCDIFTGKGAVRADKLYEKLYGVLPENRVLSHDIIEGAVLKTASSGIVVFEDAPKNFQSDVSRSARWAKGDILLLMFLIPAVRNAAGARVRLKISAFYKTVIAVNALNVLNPFFTLALAAAAYFLNVPAAFYALLFAAFLNTVLNALFALFAGNTRALYKLKSAFTIAARDIVELLKSPFYALGGITAYLATAYNLLFRQERVLEWKTFYEAQREKSGSIPRYLLPSFLPFSAVAVLDFALNGGVAIAIAALIYAAVFLIDARGEGRAEAVKDSRGGHWFFGNIRGGKRRGADKKYKTDANFLLEYAEKTYGYFRDNLRDNPLVCDNVQSRPFLGASKNTSPTNIGFSALSVVSKYYLTLYKNKGGTAGTDALSAGEGFDADAFKSAFRELERIIAAAEGLEKWRGHLYNWYDTESGKILPPAFVSSVDSANFVAAMITVKEFLDVHADIYEDFLGRGRGGRVIPNKGGEGSFAEKFKDKPACDISDNSGPDSFAERIRGLCIRARNIAEGADFSALYDGKRNLFYIGYDAAEKRFAAHYDLLASESRLLSYIGSVNSLSCWFKLNRKVAKCLGNTLYSWSGTAFEYLMADIFLRAPKGSLLYNSSRNAARVQRRVKCGGVFGLSESGYYKFDDGMRYQYRAFGVSALSLRAKPGECVISPYSSFLALEYIPKSAKKNLLRLKKIGMTGEYGFFEARDFSENKTVESYMAHHQGMIMCSVANYLSDGIISALFMRDKKIASGRQLLAEKNLTVIPVKSVKKNDFTTRGQTPKNSFFCGTPREFPAYCILSNGAYSLTCDDSGRAFSVFNGTRITREFESLTDTAGKFLYITDLDGGGVYCPTFAPLFDNRRDYETEFFGDKCVFKNARGNCSHTVRVPAGFNGEIHAFVIDNSEGETRKNLRLCFFGGDIVLGDNDAYTSHKSFYNMFITVKRERENYFVVKRKRIYKEGAEYYAAMLVKGLDVRPEFNRYNFIGGGGNLKNPKMTERGAGEESGLKNQKIIECNTGGGSENQKIFNIGASVNRIQNFRITDCGGSARAVIEYAENPFDSIGDMTEPCFGFVSEITLKKGEKREFSVIIAAADDTDGLDAAIRRAETAVFDKLISESADFADGVCEALDERENLMLTDILPRIVELPIASDKLNAVCESGYREAYVRYSVNFEYGILYYKYRSDAEEPRLVSVLRVFNRMKNAGIKVRLLISEPRADPYHNPLKGLIKRYVKDFSAVVSLDGDNGADEFFASVCLLNLNDYFNGGVEIIDLKRGRILREAAPYAETERKAENGYNRVENEKNNYAENNGKNENNTVKNIRDHGENNENNYAGTAVSDAAKRECNYTEKRECNYAENGKNNAVQNFAFASGAGYFTTDGTYVTDGSKNTVAPYSNVIALDGGGCVVTSRGGGFTFFGNSRENKVSAMSGDPVTDPPSERLFLSDGEKITRVNTGGERAEIMNGMTVFHNRFKTCRTEVSEYMVRNGKVKVFETRIENLSDGTLGMTLFLDIDAALSNKQNKNALTYAYEEDAVYVKNAANLRTAVLKAYGGIAVADKLEMNDRTGFILAERRAEDGGAPLPYPALAAKFVFFLRPGKTKKFFFALAENAEFLKDYEPETMEEDKTAALKYFEDFNKIKISTGDKYLDTMFNHRLMYQVVSSRLNGRCGFYQAGGAIGFRDQLQDVLALLHSRPDLVKRHILLAAARQYEDGGVMHWWHPPKFGIRTKISDDKLFLPYCALNYVAATGDSEILDEKIPYLVSPPLSEHERSRLENPEFSEYAEPLSAHIERAIESALKYGVHGLTLIGTGDWNDALDNIGEEGKGESVWLSMFAYEVLRLYRGTHKFENRLKYIGDELGLKKAVNFHAFDGDRFKRAFTDGGEWIGGRFSRNCRTDLLCQSWAALSGVAPADKTDAALDAAESLTDGKNRIVKLLAPPFDGEKFYGYISSYPAGVRENGGQYTHAVMWYISALFKSGRADDAYKILKLINPAEIMAEKPEQYLGEPYAVAADVSLKGKMGWSWYTGSAGLMYRVILEDMLGITLRGNRLVIKPNLPSALNFCAVEYRRKRCVYNIEIKRRGTEKGFFLNGLRISSGNGTPLKDEGNYKIEVII
jgi:cellobiose phosphorylase